MDLYWDLFFRSPWVYVEVAAFLIAAHLGWDWSRNEKIPKGTIRKTLTALKRVLKGGVVVMSLPVVLFFTVFMLLWQFCPCVALSLAENFHIDLPTEDFMMYGASLLVCGAAGALVGQVLYWLLGR